MFVLELGNETDPFRNFWLKMNLNFELEKYSFFKKN